jgi:hypothetical protein
MHIRSPQRRNERSGERNQARVSAVQHGSGAKLQVAHAFDGKSAI